MTTSTSSGVDWTAVAAIATVAYVVLTAFIAVYARMAWNASREQLRQDAAHHLGALTSAEAALKAQLIAEEKSLQKQLDEAQRTRESGLRPFLERSTMFDTSGLMLTVRNIGLGPAVKVSCHVWVGTDEMNPDDGEAILEADELLRTQYPDILDIEAIGAGRKITQSLGPLQSGTYAPTLAYLTYSDMFDKPHQRESVSEARRRPIRFVEL
jgi:hypothetical protein